MSKLRTSSGKIFDCGYWGVATVGALYVVIENTSLVEIATLVSNKDELEKLEYIENDNVVETATGFNIVVSINNAANGQVRLGLRRPYVGEETT